MHWILILNVCFAVLGTISAILAIFGETRRKDRAGIFKGLTTVGWGALVCTALTLGVVVLKEVLTQAESAQQKKENEQLRSDLKDTRAKLVTEQELFRTTSEAIQAYAYDRLSSSTYSYVSDIGIMIAHASDGWLPRSKEEFFSKKSVDLVCRWLNAEGSAQVLPTRPWYARFNDISKE